MESQSPSEPQYKRRKVVYSTTNLKVQEAKEKRDRGETYTNSKNVEVPGKVFTAVDDCCKDKCYENFSLQSQHSMFDSFYDGQNKTLQDSYLASCITKSENTKVGTDQKKQRLHTWNYCVKDGGVSTKVCQKFIISLYKVSMKRIRVIQEKLLEGVGFQERRGSHENRPHKLKGNVLELMEQHLSMLPSDYSHYCGHKSKLRYFENPNLTIKMLFEMFQNYYRESTDENLRLSYVKYFKMFKEHFHYGFSRPKTDICDFCAECKEKLKQDPNDPCKVHLQVHERKFQRRKQLKDDYISKAIVNELENPYLVLEFDYGQNYPIPRINVNSQFYKRMLWLYVFNVHVYNDDSSYFYCHMETHSTKNGNSVVSFLHDCLRKNLAKFPNTKRIILLSDATGGQNRNTTMTKFCCWFSKVYKVDILFLYPVRGHSFSQCDRNFGLVRNKVKNVERIGSAKPWLEAIVTCRETPSPFELIMDKDLVKDWETALTPLFSETPTSTMGKYTIMKYVMMKYKSSGSLLCSNTYIPTYIPFSYMLKRANKELDIDPQSMPLAGVSEAKEKDVRSLLKFLDKADAEWIEFIFDECKT